MTGSAMYDMISTFETIAGMTIDTPSFVIGVLVTSVIAATLLLLYVTVQASRERDQKLRDLPRVLSATDAFYGLIRQCEDLEKLARTQAKEHGTSVSIPTIPAFNAVRKTLVDPPWLDLTGGSKKETRKRVDNCEPTGLDRQSRQSNEWYFDLRFPFVHLRRYL